jgi:hypothetical protein
LLADIELCRCGFKRISEIITSNDEDKDGIAPRLSKSEARFAKIARGDSTHAMKAHACLGMLAFLRGEGHLKELELHLNEAVKAKECLYPESPFYNKLLIELTVCYWIMALESLDERTHALAGDFVDVIVEKYPDRDAWQYERLLRPLCAGDDSISVRKVVERLVGKLGDNAYEKAWNAKAYCLDSGLRAAFFESSRRLNCSTSSSIWRLTSAENARRCSGSLSRLPLTDRGWRSSRHALQISTRWRDRPN